MYFSAQLSPDYSRSGSFGFSLDGCLGLMLSCGEPGLVSCANSPFPPEGTLRGFGEWRKGTD